MVNTETTPQAKQLSFKEGAGVHWWQEYFKAEEREVDRRTREIGVVYWTPAESMSVDLFSYLREASTCYSVSRFLATISMSGALVEIILNRDCRMNKQIDAHRINDWITLNNRNLRLARDAGLPIDDLMEANDTVDDDSSPIRFVQLRNKVAHGDLQDFPKQLSDYSPPYEEEAKSQLKKAMGFLITWYNSSPNTQGDTEGRT